jgi:hypothetical protein
MLEPNLLAASTDLAASATRCLRSALTAMVNGRKRGDGVGQAVEVREVQRAGCWRPSNVRFRDWPDRGQRRSKLIFDALDGRLGVAP